MRPAARTLSKLLVVLWLGALAACTQGQTASPSFVYTPERGTGVVVGSVTEVYQSGPQYAHKGMSTGSYFYLADKQGKRITLTSGARPFLFVQESDNEFPGRPGLRGQAFAVELPPGDYALVDWTMEHGGYKAFGNRKNPIPIRVEAGKVSYLGNLVIQIFYRKDSDGYFYVAGARPSGFDQSARDIPAIKKKFPTLQRREVESQVLNLASWDEPVPASWSVQPIYIPIPVR
jgi:hypothetical protein